MKLELERLEGEFGYYEGVVRLSKTIWLCFDFWRSEWENDKSISEARRNKDDIAIYDASKKTVIGHIVGANLSLRDEEMKDISSDFRLVS